MISIDYTIPLGDIIKIGAVVGGGLLALIKLNNNVVSLKVDVGSMQGEIKKLGEILVAQADIRGELRGFGGRLDNAERDIRDLRKGDGFIRGPHGIDREYP